MHQNARRALRDAVLADVMRTGRPVITRTTEVDALFGGTEELLLALHHQWWTALEARVDAVLEDDPPDPAPAVAALLARLAGPARLLLDAHADLPALHAAERVRRERLVALTGIDLAALEPVTSIPATTSGRFRARLVPWWCPSPRQSSPALG